MGLEDEQYTTILEQIKQTTMAFLSQGIKPEYVLKVLLEIYPDIKEIEGLRDYLKLWGVDISELKE